VQAGYKHVADRYNMSSAKITVYRSINLVGGKRGKTISRRVAICNFRCSGSNLDARVILNLRRQGSGELQRG
jgi:hypothetical protein